jgi:hypothetical protein
MLNPSGQKATLMIKRIRRKNNMLPEHLSKRWWLLLLLSISFYSPLIAVDHNNIDAGRPLSFDDAEAVAYHEMAVESGISGIFPDGERAGLGLATEFLYGFALNTHAGIDVDAATGGRAGTSKRNFEVEDVGVNILHNFNREYGDMPAFSIRADATLPTEESSKGVKLRLRGISSKSLIQYDRIHLNLDGLFVSDPTSGERKFRPGAVVGYSTPLGYHKKFTFTGLSEVSIRTPAQEETGPLIALGIGLRQQVTVRSVIDIGMQSDILGGGGAPRENLRLTAGYSIGF